MSLSHQTLNQIGYHVKTMKETIILWILFWLALHWLCNIIVLLTLICVLRWYWDQKLIFFNFLCQYENVIICAENVLQISKSYVWYINISRKGKSLNFIPNIQLTWISWYYSVIWKKCHSNCRSSGKNKVRYIVEHICVEDLQLGEHSFWIM